MVKWFNGEDNMDIRFINILKLIEIEEKRNKKKK